MIPQSSHQAYTSMIFEEKANISSLNFSFSLFCVFFIYVCSVISLPFLGMTGRSVIKSPVKFYFSYQHLREREHLTDNIFTSRVSFPLSTALSCHCFNQNFKAFLPSLLSHKSLILSGTLECVLTLPSNVFFQSSLVRVRCQADC